MGYKGEFAEVGMKRGQEKSGYPISLRFKAETAAWVREHGYRTVRLVTSDWHLPRARMELTAALGKEVLVLGDGVPSEPRIGTLVNEYNKLILRRVALWTGIGA